MLPAILGLQVPVQSTPEGWDNICNQILKAQKDYTERERGMWHRIWYGLGDASELANIWIEFIPDEFGLAVVKTGLAVIFKVCSHQLQYTSKPWPMTNGTFL